MKDSGAIKVIRTITNTVVIALFAIVVVVVSAQVFSRFVIPFNVVWVQLGVCAFSILYLLYLALRLSTFFLL